MTFAVWVPGLPAPQGSKSYKGQSKRGRAILVESSKRLAPWREAVRKRAAAELDGRAPLDGPTEVRVTFWLPRPLSHPSTRRTLPTTYPDVDKLLRGVLDGLTSAGVIRDDSIVTDAVPRKRYVHPLSLALPGEPDEPGASIVVESLTVDEADALTWLGSARR